MTSLVANSVLEEIVGTIEITLSDYETASKRYKDVAAWFARPVATCARFSPHIYPQGSFRLGTVVRPITSAGEYDLDLGCRLEFGITKQTHTQKQLKQLVGADLEGYRAARGIKDSLEPMHRCWRLKYADTLTFHMDTVPSIPESVTRRGLIREAIEKSGVASAFAKNIADLTGSITDDRLPNYGFVSEDWRISNSEGYARWFEGRMKLASSLLNERAALAKVAQVYALPAYQWKSPLQACVQILKRHRDLMFAANPDAKPISVIITTLAAQAYRGQTVIADALDRILATMGSLVRPTVPRVPNPVNPAEDFADKWGDAKYMHLGLEENFWRWLEKAKADFQAIADERQVNVMVEKARTAFRADIDARKLAAKLGATAGASLLGAAVEPSGLGFPAKPLIPSKPGGFA